MPKFIIIRLKLDGSYLPDSSLATTQYETRQAAFVGMYREALRIYKEIITQNSTRKLYCISHSNQVRVAIENCSKVDKNSQRVVNCKKLIQCLINEEEG